MREFYRHREPQLQLTPVNLNRLVEQVIELSRARWSDMALARGAFVSVVRSLDEHLPAVMGIESELREALINLVFNALDAMPGGGTLTLGTQLATDAPGAARRRVRVVVSDSGCGMDEETRRRCLEPFFTTKGERGTGLGLPMVYGVVERHRAELIVESMVGRGTTIGIVFDVPLESAEALSEAPSVEILPALRLLIVDDDPLLIKSLREALEGDGHQIVTADGGQAGIDTFRSSSHAPFAAVITDLGMPFVDGRRVSEAIKTASPTTPVILLTGWGQRLVAEDDVPPHVDFVVNKPPRLRELRAALARCLKLGSPSPWP
jgi:CheY-like chemotaxis protein/anti-sigma regulatory factor (Ser/Thr protein kinase)